MANIQWSVPLEVIEPWAITPDAFRAVLDGLRSPSALMARDAVPVEGTNVTMRGSVAVLHVKGALFRYHSWMTAYLGCSSYGELRKDLQRCIDDPGSKAILFVIDSPGGEVNGCAELADAIFAARSSGKPMAAYVSGIGASAAYFLTSAVGKVYCSATSMLGSIGVITTLYDDTKMLADMGLKEFEIVSTQSPKISQQPGDASYRARVQQRIDDLAEVFVSRVAQYRGVRPATVTERYGQGDVLIGARAVKAGLADEVSDVELVLAELTKKITPSMWFGGTTTKGQTTMNAEKQQKKAAKYGLAATASAEEIKAAKHAAKAKKYGLAATASAEQVKGARKAAKAEKRAARAPASSAPPGDGKVPLAVAQRVAANPFSGLSAEEVQRYAVKTDKELEAIRRSERSTR